MDLISLEKVEDISVDSYSIFDLFDNDTFKQNETEEITLDKKIEQAIEAEILQEETTQYTNTLDELTEQVIETEILEEKTDALNEKIEEEEVTQSIKTINDVIEQTIETKIIEEDIILPNEIIEKSVNDIIVNNPSIIFNGIVSKSSISIETDKEHNNTLETIFEPVQFNEEISLFKEIETVNTSEKKEKKKKSKGTSSEGQISLF